MKLKATFTFDYEADPEAYGTRDMTASEMAIIDRIADPWDLFQALYYKALEQSPDQDVRRGGFTLRVEPIID